MGIEFAFARRIDNQLTAGHAFTHVIVGVAFDVHVQATGIPDTEALTRGTFKGNGDWHFFHIVVAVMFGDFTRQ